MNILLTSIFIFFNICLSAPHTNLLDGGYCFKDLKTGDVYESFAEQKNVRPRRPHAVITAYFLSDTAYPKVDSCALCSVQVSLFENKLMQVHIIWNDSAEGTCFAAKLADQLREPYDFTLNDSKLTGWIGNKVLVSVTAIGHTMFSTITDIELIQQNKTLKDSLIKNRMINSDTGEQAD